MKRLLTTCLAILASTLSATAEPTRAAQIEQRLRNANAWRGHILVVGHRGGVLENGRVARAENSVEAIEHAIRLGAEMVELDVRQSKDGELVVMHDSYLDRTTTCRGAVADWTFASMRTCRLTVNGRATNEVVPTLRDLLAVARGRVLVNVDNKMGFDDLLDVAALVREMGMDGQVVVKENIWSTAKLDAASQSMAAMAGLRFMPILADDAVREPGFVEAVTKRLAPDLVEMIAWRGSGATADGGALFSRPVRAAAIRGDWHVWINTFAIVEKPGGYLAGGRGDELAVAASFPDEAFGFWIDRGTTIIQTDEPQAAIRWLEEQGLRIPYAETSANLASQ